MRRGVSDLEHKEIEVLCIHLCSFHFAKGRSSVANITSAVPGLIGCAAILDNGVTVFSFNDNKTIFRSAYASHYSAQTAWRLYLVRTATVRSTDYRVGTNLICYVLAV